MRRLSRRRHRRHSVKWSDEIVHRSGAVCRGPILWRCVHCEHGGPASAAEEGRLQVADRSQIDQIVSSYIELEFFLQSRADGDGEERIVEQVGHGSIVGELIFGRDALLTEDVDGVLVLRVRWHSHCWVREAVLCGRGKKW